MKFSKRLYRRKVGFFKIASILALGGLLFTLFYYGFNNKLENEPTDAPRSKAKSYGIEISDSIFEGSDERGKTYQLTSKSLIKSGNDIYDLITISGKYNLQKNDVDLKANTGKMNDSNKILSLVEKVIVECGEYLLTTEHLDIDLTKMSAQNNKEVSVIYRNSDIRADKFKIDTDSNLLYFEGNVLTHFKISDF